jgi:hypothetical protein
MAPARFPEAADALAPAGSDARLGLAAIAAACGLSLALYLASFLFVFHKPFTIGAIGQYLAHKQAYLEGLHGPKIVILAGSNGRFGHRCRLIEARTGRGCANVSISADISVEYQLEKIRPALASGDILYLPLEYRAKPAPAVGIEGPYAVAYDQAALLHMEPSQALNSLFYFDLPFLISAAGEMALATVHHDARYSVRTMNANGDETGHSERRAVEFRSHLRETAPVVVDAAATLDGMQRSKGFTEFLAWAAANGVRVVGGLPTTFENTPIPAGLVDELRAFYETRGHCFIALPNLSLYPRTAFLDTPFHLAEQAQIRHSGMLVPYFMEMARNPARCPA